MPLSRPTLTELVDETRSDLDSNLPGADSRLRRSVLDVLARMLAWASHALYGYIDYISDQIFPDTADAEHLERWASLWSLQRTAAVFATGSVVFSGTNGSQIPAATVVRRADGVEYETDSLGTISGGTATVAVTAKVAGVAGNASASQAVALLSPLSGVDSAATVEASGITGGADQETDTALRSRVLTRMQQPPHGGAAFDYVRWAKEVSGVTRAWVIQPTQQSVEAFDAAALSDPASDVAGNEFSALGFAFVEFVVQAGAFTSGTLNALINKADVGSANDEDASGDVVDGSLPAMGAAGIARFVVAVDPDKPLLTLSVDAVGDPVFASFGAIANMGLGDVLVLFTRDDDGDGPFPSAGEIAAVQAYIDADTRRPVTAKVRVQAPTALTVDITVAITPDTTEVRAAVQAELEDLFLREGAPGVTIPLTHIAEAISIAPGETDHNLTVPSADVAPTATQLPVLGTITWA